MIFSDLSIRKLAANGPSQALTSVFSDLVSSNITALAAVNKRQVSLRHTVSLQLWAHSCDQSVPKLYPTTAVRAVPATRATRKISKLRALNTGSGFESHPLRHIHRYPHKHCITAWHLTSMC